MDTTSLMTEEEVKAVRDIVDYLYNDEEKDYLACEDDGVRQDSHIFLRVKTLKNWLTKNYGKAN